MGLESDMDVLGEVPLFRELTRDQLRLLAFGAEHRQLRAGEILFRAEARADAGFVVAGGTVHLLEGEGAERRVGGSAERGTLLGELALLVETRRPVTAVAATDCDLIRIPRPLFRRMLTEYPEFAVSLEARLRAEFLDMSTRILALSPAFEPDEDEPGA